MPWIDSRRLDKAIERSRRSQALNAPLSAVGCGTARRTQRSRSRLTADALGTTRTRPNDLVGATLRVCDQAVRLVGVTKFEPGTSSSRTRILRPDGLSGVLLALVAVPDRAVQCELVMLLVMPFCCLRGNDLAGKLYR